MAANINVILNGASIQVVNTNDSTTRVNSSAGNPTLSASESTYMDFLPIAVAGTVLTLPVATIYVLYIRNLGGINSAPSGSITVSFTASGGAQVAAANAPVILPGGVFAIWNSSNSSGGITAVTLTASTANTPVEVLMAA